MAQAPLAPSPVSAPTGTSVEAYFNGRVTEIKKDPAAYAAFQKLMVRKAMAEQFAPSFCQVVAAAWPQ